MFLRRRRAKQKPVKRKQKESANQPMMIAADLAKGVRAEPARPGAQLDYATSSNALGLRSATRRSVRAAPEGARRPCSQSCNVRTDTPSRVANRACERPVFSRMLATSGTLTTRLCSPRLISRSPSRISRPMLRFVLVIFRLLPNLPEYMPRNILCDVLRVHRQHPYHSVSASHVVNDPVTAALTATE